MSANHQGGGLNRRVPQECSLFWRASLCVEDSIVKKGFRFKG